jgi:predicted AAA+ superfamily ATPase
MPQSAQAPLVQRHLQGVIAQRLAEEPVVVLNGARTVGKSTLMRACADAHGVEVIDLDDPTTRRAVEADPALFLTQVREPVCIDEFQHVLPILDVIKFELNRDLRPGRYLLTGSTRYSSLPAASQSLTGRAHVVTMWPLSQGELRGQRETFLDTLLSDNSALVVAQPSSTTRSGYEAAVLVGGFPIATVRTTEASRSRWFNDFVTMVVERDVLEMRQVRQRSVLPQVLRHLAGQTAQVLNAAAVGARTGIDKSAAGDYVRLLEAVFLVHRLDGYGRTLSSRTRLQPKVHLVDSGLAAHLLGVTSMRLSRRDPTVLTEFGHVVETFAVNEVLKQASWSDRLLRFSHFRTKDGAEVDLVIETAEGKVAGIEVKAAASASAEDFRGLRLLRDRLGDDFIGGVVLHLGQRSYRHEEKLSALPLDRLWS